MWKQRQRKTALVIYRIGNPGFDIRGDNGTLFQILKKLIGAFLLVRNLDVLIDIFTVTGTGRDKAADNDILLVLADSHAYP